MGTSSGLKKNLLQHFIVPVSQNLGLGGTTTISGEWFRAGDPPGGALGGPSALKPVTLPRPRADHLQVTEERK